MTKPVLQWKNVQKKLAWDVILLLGGGFALASMVDKTGLGDIIGRNIQTLAESIECDRSLTILIVIIGTSITTGFTSNVSTAQIFLPILGNFAESINVNVDMFMVPATIACSFAFILPISTPPNAIAFSTVNYFKDYLTQRICYRNIIYMIIPNFFRHINQYQ